MEKIISATKAVKESSEILNTVRFRGDHYVIQRKGKSQAVPGPVEKRRRWRPLKELKGIFKELPKLHDELDSFASDLKHIARGQLSLPRRAKWD